MFGFTKLPKNYYKIVTKLLMSCNTPCGNMMNSAVDRYLNRNLNFKDNSLEVSIFILKFVC